MGPSNELFLSPVPYENMSIPGIQLATLVVSMSGKPWAPLGMSRIIFVYKVRIKFEYVCKPVYLWILFQKLSGVLMK